MLTVGYMSILKLRNIVNTFKWYNNSSFYRLGVVACVCNPATWKPGLVDRLRSGVLLIVGLWRLGVRTKLGIDMVGSAEAKTTRSSKEGRTGPGRKRSRQKSPCGAVVGLRP